MSHLPIDDDDDDWNDDDVRRDDDERWLGVAVTGCAAEPDDPQPVYLIPHVDAAKDLAAVSYTLERLTETMASVLLGVGVHPALCVIAAIKIRAAWEVELQGGAYPRAPQDSAM